MGYFISRHRTYFFDDLSALSLRHRSYCRRTASHHYVIYCTAGHEFFSPAQTKARVMWNIQTFTEIPSTQKLAKENFHAGMAKHGDVFAALHQTEGAGRYPDRTWYDEFGANLLMSIVLTDIPPHLQDKMQFVAALSVLTIVRTQLSIRNR